MNANSPAKSSFLRSRLIAEWLVLLVAMLALLIVSHQRSWTQRFDLFLLDLEGQINTPALDPSIVLLKIDDRTLAQSDTWPWDRSIHADLIERLSSYGPRAIGYDVLFMEPSVETADTRLANALIASDRVVLPHTFDRRPDTENERIPFFPLPLFREGASGIGHVDLGPEEDGVARKFELIHELEGEAYPHLVVSLLELAGVEPWGEEGPAQSGFVRYPNRDDFIEYSAASVLDESALPSTFEDAIVLVGSTAQGLGDRHSVPAYAEGILPGVEIQIALTNAILTDNLIARASAPWTLGLQITVVLLLFASFWRLSPRSALIVAIALVAGLFATFFISLMAFNIWLPVGGALLAIVIAYPLWGWRRLASVSRFLEIEAANLRELASVPQSEANEGFDVIAQQVSMLRRLTKGVSGNLTLIQDVINASPDAMLVTDGQGAISMGNFAAQDLFGPINEVQGFALTQLLVTAGGRLNEGRDELALGDGRTFWLASADLDPDVGSQVLSLREVTEIKEAERQRRETLEFLSHDMRSPQVAIISLANQVDDGLAMKDRFTRINDQARRTLKLTEDFVQIARIANEGVEREETEMNSVLQEAADRAFPLAHKKQIRVEFEASEDPLFARLDPFAVSRMLDNLISNAVKFSPEGARVELGLKADGAKLCVITVADTGPGLSAERKAEPFARFGARNTDAGPSSGLGLAYVKQVVDLHEGSIEVDTQQGVGTTFVIKFPTS